MTVRTHAAALLLGFLLAGCSDPKTSKLRHFENGKRLTAEKNYREAIIEFKNALKYDNRDGEIRYALAQTYGLAGQRVEAGRQYIAAAELLPNSSEAQTQAAGVLLSSREYERARKHAETAITLDPKNVEAQIVLGLTLAGLKDIDGAIQEMQEAVEMAPGDYRAYAGLGSMLVAAGSTADAEKALKRAVEVAPKSIDANLALGYFYWSTNRVPEAERIFRTANALGPEDIATNRVLAMFYLNIGRPADAETPLLRLANMKDSRAMLALADLYVGKKEEDKARGLLASVAGTRDPNARAVAAVRLAMLDYSAGKTQQAHDAIDKLLKEQPNNVVLTSAKVRWALLERRVDEALKIASKAASAAPGSAGAQYVLGLVYVAARQPEDAVKAFKETLRINPRVADAEVQLSRLMLFQGNTQEALSYAEAAYKQQATMQAQLEMVTALLAKRDLVRADEELKKLMTTYPESSAVHGLRGALLLARSDGPGAVREFDRALELDSANVQALSARVTMDILQKRPDDGRARLKKAITEKPDRSALIMLAARFENTVGDVAAAERYLRKSIEMDPSNLDAYGMLGRMYVAQKRLDDAKVEFERIVARRSDSVGAKTMIAMILGMQQRTEESMRAYEDVLKASPRAVVASNNLAYMYATRGEKLDAALQLARVAKQQMPDRPEIDDTVGFVYYKKNLPELAIASFKLCADKDPTNPIYQYHLGLAYAKAGFPDKARESLEKALNLKASFPGADEARAVLASIQG